METLILIIIGCAIIGKIWADLFLNEIIDHDSASAHVQGEEIEKW